MLPVSTTVGRLLYCYDLFRLDIAIATILLADHIRIFPKPLRRRYNLILNIAAVCDYAFLTTCVTLVSALRRATWFDRAVLTRLRRRLLPNRLIVD